MQAKWLMTARQLVGISEVPGPGNHPTIMNWGNRLGAKVLGIAYGADSVPWCGLFMAWCIAEAGLKPPPIAIRAKAWASWGQDCGMTATRPPLGAIAVFGRDGGGHVGQVTGVYRNGDLLILGGNQGDAANERRFKRARLIALRWPTGAAWAGTAPWADGPGVVSTRED